MTDVVHLNSTDSNLRELNDVNVSLSAIGHVFTGMIGVDMTEEESPTPIAISNGEVTFTSAVEPTYISWAAGSRLGVYRVVAGVPQST